MGNAHCAGLLLAPVALCAIALSPPGAYETGGHDDTRSGDDRRGDARGRRLPRGSHLSEENGHSLQPDDPAALQAGSSVAVACLPEYVLGSYPNNSPLVGLNRMALLYP